MPLIILLFSISLLGQSNAEIEGELVGHLKNISKWSNYGGEPNENLLSSENAIFRKKLLSYASRKPSMIRFPFNELNKHLQIATSEDKRFRIYSWDTGTGGTMRFYENVFQFVGRNGKVYAKGNDEEGNANGFFNDIFTLKTGSGKVYMATSTTVLSSSYRGQSIQLFKINNRSLKSEVNLIKTRTGLTNSIGFAYDFFSVVDRKRRPIRLFRYDSKTKTIRFPVVIENEKFRQGEVTNRSISYRFNGRYFEKVKR